MPNKKKKGFRRHLRDSQSIVRQTYTCRQSKRKLWSEAQMSGALDAVTNGELKVSEAVVKYGVPRQTLRDRLTGHIVHSTNPGPKPYLTKEEEELLTDHLILSAKLGYGKTRMQTMDLVERYINEKPGNDKEVRISSGWWDKFMKRNPSLRLRCGDSTAGVRMEAVNTENINDYFDLLQDVFEKKGFANHPEAIYNMDETGMPLEPHPPRVVA